VALAPSRGIIGGPPSGAHNVAPAIGPASATAGKV